MPSLFFLSLRLKELQNLVLLHIVVAEDHPLFRKGLILLLSSMPEFLAPLSFFSLSLPVR